MLCCAKKMMFFLKQWLNEEKLAQRLIELIHPERDEEVDLCVSIATCTPVGLCAVLN